MTLESLATQSMKRWLREASFTGCSFAASFAKAGEKLFSHVITEAAAATKLLATELAPPLAHAASQHHAALFIFPDLRTDNDVASVILNLCQDAAWQWHEEPWRKHGRGDVLISLQWRTPAGNLSTALGLAPLGTMPITRRAPYVCIVVWPGGHENPYWPTKGGNVSLADMPHDFNEEVHAAMRSESEAKTKDLLDSHAEGAADYRVSFCLDASVRRRLKPRDGLEAR